MSGSGPWGIWQTAQAIQQSLASIVQLLTSGVLIDPAPKSYTVATLPATAAAGQQAWASDGRKPGEGAGTGTGVPVFFNNATATWYSYLSGAQVTS